MATKKTTHNEKCTYCGEELKKRGNIYVCPFCGQEYTAEDLDYIHTRKGGIK